MKYSWFIIISIISMQALASKLNETLSRLPNSTQISAEVYDFKTHKLIYQHRPNKLMNAASTAKLFTAIAAADKLGKSFKIKTKIASIGKVNAGVLAGDVWLKFNADPSFSMADLTKLFVALKEHGIQKIKGNVYLVGKKIIDHNYGPGWMLDDIKHCYAAPITAYNLNENCLVISFDKLPKAKPKVSLSIPKGATVSNKLYWRKSCPANTEAKITADKDGYKWKGCVSKKHFADTVAAQDVHQLLRAGVMLAMQKAKVSCSGKIKFNNIWVTKPVDWVFTVQSSSLETMLNEMLKESNNLYSSSLFLQLGAKKQSFSWHKSATWLQQYLADWLVIPPVLVDGSGLSRLNKISVHNLVELLTKIVAHKNIFELICPNLATVGYDGTLAFSKIKVPVGKKIVGKTGSMIGVDAISGYVLVNDKVSMVYALILNGANQDKKLMRAVRESWLQVLVKMS